MSKRDKEDKEDAHRQIPPTPQDPEMLGWLESLFHISERDVEVLADRTTGVPKPKSEPDTFPDKIILRSVFGAGGRDLGPQLKEKVWKPTSQQMPQREHLVVLANELLGYAQQDCNVNRKQQRYTLFAYSNFKGADAYEKYSFLLLPTAKEYGGKNPPPPATDDEDTHRDRLLSATLAHSRWEREQNNEFISSLMKLQNEIISQQRQEIMQMAAERRAMIITAEEALSKKQERDEKAEFAKLKHDGMRQGLELLAGTVGPLLQGYLTKGKAGITQGLGKFFESLDDTTKITVFGRWNERNECLEPGILDSDQVQFFLGVMGGSIDPKRITEFMTMLRPEQIQAVQNTVPMEKLAQLAAIVKMASDVSGQS